MGCRDKHIKPNRRTQSAKHTTPSTPSDVDDDHHQQQEHHQNMINERTKSMHEFGGETWCYNMGFNDSCKNTSNPNDPIPNAAQNPSFFDDCGWGYCTEKELEEILLQNLKIVFNEAVSKLVAMGYDEDVALKTVMRYGHSYGSLDVLSNVLHNSLAYLNSGSFEDDGGLDECGLGFTDLRQWQDYSLLAMVSLLQQMRPALSRGDAMWCLLMSDLHVIQAGAIEIPMLPSQSNSSGNGVSRVDNIDSNAASSGVSVSPGMCKFHGGWGFANGSNLEPSGDGLGGVFSYLEGSVQRDIDCPKTFKLSPTMKSLLKKNVSALAAGFQVQQMQMQSQPCTSSAVSGDSTKGTSLGAAVPGELCEESHDNNPDVVNSVLNKLRELNLDESVERLAEDQKDEIIVALLHQEKDLEEQVKERKEWAHQRALQAAEKLSNDLTELKLLRMEREETLRLKKGKQTLEDTTMKRISDMENALRKASSQVDRANAAVRQLEIENAEVRAEMGAFRLSAEESETTLSGIKKREKKSSKRLQAWEKQKNKLQEEIAAERQKVADLKHELAQIHAAQKETEAKLKQEVKEKEQAMGQVEEETRVKEKTEGENKRKLEALCSRLDIDFQRHKDDVERLEQELSRLQASVEFTDKNPLDTFSSGSPKSAKLQRENITQILRHLDEPEKETGCGRECLICKREEVCVVFLPCAHEVTCASCAEDYEKGKDTCPCCGVLIEQKIQVYGASSS